MNRREALDTALRRLAPKIPPHEFGAVIDHALDSAGLPLASVTVTRPTLDDVFLTLTGHSLRDGDDGTQAAQPAAEPAAATAAN